MLRRLVQRLPRATFVQQCRRLHSNKNYYEILNVEKTASGDDIREAFLDQSKKYHPDTSLSTDQAENAAKFREIVDAYRVLSNEHLRSIYDDKERVEAILQGQFPDYEDLDMHQRNRRNAANDNERYSESGPKQYGSRRYEVPTPGQPKAKETDHFDPPNHDEFFLPVLGFLAACIVILCGFNYYRQYQYEKYGGGFYMTGIPLKRTAKIE